MNAKPKPAPSSDVPYDYGEVPYNYTSPTAPPKTLALPKPDTEIVVNRAGVARHTTVLEKNAADIKRTEFANISLTPDVRRAINRTELRKKFGPVWDKIQTSKQEKIQAEIAAMWKKTQRPINDIIDEAVKRAASLQSEAGIKPGNLSEALKGAKPLKTPAKNVIKNNEGKR